MTTNISNYLNIIKNDWVSAEHLFPDFLLEISAEAKANNEQYFQMISVDFQKQLKSFPHIPIGRKKWKLKMLTLIKGVLYKETIIGLHKSTDQQTIDAFQEEIKAFLHQVRIFAPELSFSDIGQAIRNYMVYVMFKEINQIKSDFNMAGFGYSMLYPFTDNYIDNMKYSDKEKLEYNQIIRDKLEDKEVHPQSLHQQKTCDLLQAIELQYPRAIDSTIYELLLMMLEAQEDSIRQQNKGILLTTEERLDISLYKGGISVLIDRFFVKKKLNKEDYIFYLGMGFFLQLADDLQDIKEDSLQGHQTIFTIDLHSHQEEKIVNKMLHFIHQIMADYPAENDNFKNFVLTNCYQLIFTSAVGSKEFFSQEYLDQLEKYLPVTYPYLEKMRNNKAENKDMKIQDKYMKMLDEILS